MKTITLALVIALGFCAGEAMAQMRGLGPLRERRALREQQEFENLVASGGNVEGKLKLLEEDASKARAKLEKMLALDEKSKTLSADALAIYTSRVEVLRRNYETCSNRLAHARTILTPEKIAELTQKKKVEEEKKAREQKAKEEYRAFAADADEGFAEEIQRREREKERAAQRAQLVQIQEELRKQRETKKHKED